jgi:hypothetical protein
MRNSLYMQKIKTLALVALVGTMIFATSCSRKSHLGCPGQFGNTEKQEQHKDA